MKNILIRLGKIKSFIKKNGLMTGIKIILFRYCRLYFKAFFNFTPGDVLIITAGVGDSAFYRAFNYAEELNLNGLETSVTIQDSPFLNWYVSRYKIFIFQRTLMTPTIEKLIKKIKKEKKEIIFETDDLVFDAKYIKQTDLYKNEMNSAEKLQYQKGVGGEIVKDDYVKVCTAPTSYLAKKLEEYGKKVFIVKNKFSNYELKLTQKILDKIPKEKDEAIRIGYFSGTSSHNKDFASVTDALTEILAQYPQTKLFLAGPLDTENKLNQYQNRIVTLPFVSRNKYYENVWKVDINIAPLVLGDPFCEAKSEIKFTEAGILKIPTVAVKNQTFSEAIRDGQDGFLAKTKTEWVEKLGILIEDAQLRKEMGEKARDKILKNYTNKNSHNEDYYQYLRQIINKKSND